MSTTVTQTQSPSQAPNTSFTQRRIEVTFTMQPTQPLAGGPIVNPPFVEGGNQVTLRGLRTSVAIKKAGGFSMGEMHLRLYGLSLSLMNQLSTLGRIPLAGRNNTVSVSAGDELNGLGVCFSGTITNAWADFKGSQNVSFNVVAHAGMAAALAAVPPNSYRGSTSVAVIMASLAQQMNVAFENNGVASQLADPYFPGTLWAQVQACAQAAGIAATLDNGVLVIVPRGGSRGGRVPLLNPVTGMVGYPAFTQNGIAATAIYNPNIQLHGLVQIESDLTPANGRWRVYNVTHELEAETPGGAWFTAIEASDPAFAPVR